MKSYRKETTYNDEKRKDIEYIKEFEKRFRPRGLSGAVKESIKQGKEYLNKLLRDG